MDFPPEEPFFPRAIDCKRSAEKVLKEKYDEGLKHTLLTIRNLINSARNNGKFFVTVEIEEQFREDVAKAIPKDFMVAWPQKGTGELSITIDWSKANEDRE